FAEQRLRTMGKKPVRDRQRQQVKTTIDFGPWRPHAVRIAALWAIALIAYSNSFKSGLIFDNFWLIVQASRVHAVTGENLGLILTQEYWYNSTLTGLYRPLTTLSYLFNYAILGGGDRPGGYHAINFAMHAINIALVYGLALIIFRE